MSERFAVSGVTKPDLWRTLPRYVGSLPKDVQGINVSDAFYSPATAGQKETCATFGSTVWFFGKASARGMSLPQVHLMGGRKHTVSRRFSGIFLELACITRQLGMVGAKRQSKTPPPYGKGLARWVSEPCYGALFVQVEPNGFQWRGDEPDNTCQRVWVVFKRIDNIGMGWGLLRNVTQVLHDSSFPPRLSFRVFLFLVWADEYSTPAL